MEKKIIITIGRQYGAGGRATAAAIGRKLGIPVYDNTLLGEAAKESGFSPSLFKKRDEKRHIFSLSSLFSSQESNATNYLGDNALFQLQSETIRDIAGKESCVIVGRCADYILRDFEGVLKVFITSPYEERKKRVMERMGLDSGTVDKIIQKKEQSRMNFYNAYTLGRWGDVSNYDLCIDSSRLGIEGTADTIIYFAEKAGLL